MENDNIKICQYCNSKFFRLDFPRSFDRMVTCGTVECEGKRRKELWRNRFTMKNGLRAG